MESHLFVSGTFNEQTQAHLSKLVAEPIGFMFIAFPRLNQQDPNTWLDIKNLSWNEAKDYVEEYINENG